MKSIFNLFLVASIFVFTMSCSSDSSEDIAPETNQSQNLVIPQSKTIEIEIMELINEYRISQGFNVLNNNGIIKGQAYTHTEYMVVNDNVSHDNFYARKSYLINNVGAEAVTENVAFGFTNAQSVVNAWLNSEGHKQNIEGDFTDFEISAEQNADGKWYFTNIFVKK